MASAGKVTRIALERTPCFGTCPAYTVSIDHCGHFTWVGQHFVPVTGRHNGEVRRPLFTALARMVDAFGFNEWDEAYVEPVTDFPATILGVERDGTLKTVRQSGTDEPPNLQVLATFIDGMVTHALWQLELD